MQEQARPDHWQLLGIVPAERCHEVALPPRGHWVIYDRVAAALGPASTSAETWQQAHFRAIPLLPLRLQRAWIVPDLEGWLREHTATLVWFLEDLGGCGEWLVTARCAPGQPLPSAPDDEADVPFGLWLWRRVRAGSEDACPLPLTASRAAEGEFLAGAVLVAFPAESQWLAGLNSLQQELADSGISLNISGPFPAWHFTPFADDSAMPNSPGPPPTAQMEE